MPVSINLNEKLYNLDEKVFDARKTATSDQGVEIFNARNKKVV